MRTLLSICIVVLTAVSGWAQGFPQIGSLPGPTTISVAKDGVTDVTAALQGYFSTPGSYTLPAGVYLANELYPTNNVRVIGYGANLKYAAGRAGAFINCGQNTNIVLEGLEISGGWTTNLSHFLYQQYFSGGSVLDLSANPDQFGYYNWSARRHGVIFNTGGGGAIRNCYIHGFDGNGLTPFNPVGPNAMITVPCELDGITCQSNGVGIFAAASISPVAPGANFIVQYMTNYVSGSVSNAEYVRWKNIRCFQNAIGIVAAAGNNQWINCDVSFNYIGVGFWGGDNSDHGTFENTEINHNLGYAVYSGQISAGEIFSGCHFRGSTAGIFLNNSKGVLIQNCMLNPISITCQSTAGQNFFRNNLYSGLWSSYTISNDGGLAISGNASYDNVGNTDGSALTDISLGNAPVWSGSSGNTTLAAATTYFFAPNFYSSTLPTADASAGTRQPVTRTTKIRNLYLTLSAAGGSGKHYVATVMTNGVATSIVADSNNSTTASDTTHSETVVAGVEVGLKIVVDSGATVAKASWSLEGN